MNKLSCGRNIAGPMFGTEFGGGHVIIRRLNSFLTNSSFSSSRTIFATGGTNIPLFVFTSTALTTPESPVIARITRPSGQTLLGESVSTTRTRTPCFRLRTWNVHFRLSRRLGTYSPSQRLQTWFVTA